MYASLDTPLGERFFPHFDSFSPNFPLDDFPESLTGAELFDQGVIINNRGGEVSFDHASSEVRFNFEDHQRLVRSAEWQQQVSAPLGSKLLDPQIWPNDDRGPVKTAWDLGSAAGHWTNELLTETLARNAVGVDIVKALVDRAKQRHAGKPLQFVQGDIANLREVVETSIDPRFRTPDLIWCRYALGFVDGTCHRKSDGTFRQLRVDVIETARSLLRDGGLLVSEEFQKERIDDPEWAALLEFVQGAVGFKDDDRYVGPSTRNTVHRLHPEETISRTFTFWPQGRQIHHIWERLVDMAKAKFDEQLPDKIRDSTLAIVDDMRNALGSASHRDKLTYESIAALAETRQLIKRCEARLPALKVSTEPGFWGIQVAQTVLKKGGFKNAGGVHNLKQVRLAKRV